MPAGGSVFDDGAELRRAAFAFVSVAAPSVADGCLYFADGDGGGDVSLARVALVFHLPSPLAGSTSARKFCGPDRDLRGARRRRRAGGPGVWSRQRRRGRSRAAGPSGLRFAGALDGAVDVERTTENNSASSARVGVPVLLIAPLSPSARWSRRVTSSSPRVGCRCSARTAAPCGRPSPSSSPFAAT